MTGQETVPKSPHTRIRLPMIGLCLWILVFAALFFLWRERPAKDSPSLLTSELKDGDGQSLAPSTGKNTQGSDGKQSVPIVLNPTAENSGPTWDPQGIEDFELTTHTGEKISKSQLLGRPWVVCFIFTYCAGPCPRVAGQMLQLQKRFTETDIQFVTITVDPERDTPERLATWADVYGGDLQKSLFLTGDKQRIYHLIRDSFQMPVREMQGELRKPGFEILHTTNILHVNAQGVVVGKYDSGDDAQMAALRRALRKEWADLQNDVETEQPESPAATKAVHEPAATETSAPSQPEGG